MVHDEFETYKGIILGWRDIALEIEGSTKLLEKVAEEQEFLLSYTNAILRTDDATEENYKAVTFGLLIDLAIVSLCQLAPRDKKGSYLYDTDHAYLIEATKFMVELSRQRRCVYGEQWYLSASDSLKSNELRFSHGYSPLRQKTYCFVSMPKVTDDIVNSFANDTALNIMNDDQTSQCMIYAASSLNIVHTYDHLKSLVVGQQDPAEMEDKYIVDTKCAYISR